MTDTATTPIDLFAQVVPVTAPVLAPPTPNAKVLEWCTAITPTSPLYVPAVSEDFVKALRAEVTKCALTLERKFRMSIVTGKNGAKYVKVTTPPVAVQPAAEVPAPEGSAEEPAPEGMQSES